MGASIYSIAFSIENKATSRVSEDWFHVLRKKISSNRFVSSDGRVFPVSSPRQRNGALQSDMYIVNRGRRGSRSSIPLGFVQPRQRNQRGRKTPKDSAHDSVATSFFFVSYICPGSKPCHVDDCGSTGRAASLSNRRTICHRTERFPRPRSTTTVLPFLLHATLW